MSTFATIHAGPLAPALKKLLGTLDTTGTRETYFMTDLVSVLRYEDDFIKDLNCLQGDILFGEYYKYRLYRNYVGGSKIEAQRFLEDTAILSTRIAKYLHSTLITQGRYDKDGKFPYEFHSFDGRVISLRGL